MDIMIPILNAVFLLRIQFKVIPPFTGYLTAAGLKMFVIFLTSVFNLKSLYGFDHIFLWITLNFGDNNEILHMTNALIFIITKGA